MSCILDILLYLLAHLPIWALRAISCLMAFINCNIVRYRWKVVLDNLRNAFPDKNEKERKQIAKKYYIQLCDYLLGMVRVRYNNAPILDKLIFHKNPELLQSLYNQGKSVILACGHYFTWEYTNTLPLASFYQVIAAYSPLSSKFSDKMMKRCRTKYGVVMFPKNDIYRALVKYQQEKIQTMALMVADQSPTENNLDHWITFMGQDTPVLIGVEHIAGKLKQAVVFLKVTQPKRFVYEYEYVLISDGSTDEQPMAIMSRWYTELEKMIRQRPEMYLWSHRRWKHKDKKPKK